MTEQTVAEAIPDATAAEQLALVAHLSDRLSALFRGAAPEQAEIRGRYPSRVLQLGALPPLPEPGPDDTDTPEELAKRFQRPPSSMGLDFELIESPDGSAAVEVEARFSVYVQRYPDRDAQEEFFRGGTERDTREEEQDGAAGEGDNMRLLPLFRRYDIDTGRIRIELDPDRDEHVHDLAPLRQQLGSVLADAKTVYPFWARRSQTLPVDALDGDQAHFEHAIAEAEGDARTRPLAPPQASIVVNWQPADADGHLRVQATLRNDTQVALGARKHKPARAAKKGDTKRELVRDLDLFDARLRVFQDEGAFSRQRFRRAPRDFRYAELRSVWAVGRNCHGRRMDPDTDGADGVEEPLTTDVWPTYAQKRMGPRARYGDYDLTVTFAELAEQATSMQALERVGAAMKQFRTDWQTELGGWDENESKRECEKALANFLTDIDAFERGLDCLRRDERLRTALRAANAVFADMGRDREIVSWRLFQLVYQVMHLAALAVRENPDDEQLLAELDTVDVLWFPTGGGKTEAYLGLIVAAMFYDRLRGKQRGVTAFLRFPLRMLSVQQLQRLLVAVAASERERQRLIDAAGVALDGDGFALGFWAGGGNSPNSLSYVSEDDGTNHPEHIDWWARHIAEDAHGGDEERIITVCPDPDCKGKVRLVADREKVRLRHVCSQCGKDAPVYISDEEVYRYLPAVVVSTVDKLAQVARADQFVNILAGPAYSCPDHGYFTWHGTGSEYVGGKPTITDRCIVGERCKLAAEKYQRAGETKDPAPVLIVQDELHLLEEELGTFASHYDTLLAALQRRLGVGLPSKLLAATATIEAFEEQTRNLYAREARVFPSPGWKLGESFYVTTDADAVRRLYVGGLPARPDVTEFGALAQAHLLAEVIRMRRNPGYGLQALGLDSERDEHWLAKLLLDYELTLGYVNRKQDADRISYLLNRLHSGGDIPEALKVKVLIGGGSSGGTPLAEIADTLNEIGSQYRDRPDPEQRLRALVATSVISHGVDLDALNLMVVNNMTPTVAQYVQASSRAGRSNVGLVVVSFDRRNARQRGFFTFFREYHAFLDRMIAPVPVNRFARFAVATTMPGIMSALIIQVLGRERLERRGLDPAKELTSLVVGTENRRYLTSPEAPADTMERLRELAVEALAVGARVYRRVDGEVKRQLVFPPRLSEWLEQEARLQFDKQKDNVLDLEKRGRLPKWFRPAPLRSFREVDDPVEFQVMTRDTDIQGDLTRRADD